MGKRSGMLASEACPAAHRWSLIWWTAKKGLLSPHFRHKAILPTWAGSSVSGRLPRILLSLRSRQDLGLASSVVYRQNIAVPDTKLSNGPLFAILPELLFSLHILLAPDRSSSSSCRRSLADCA
jgi:hypothetical protein